MGLPTAQGESTAAPFPYMLHLDNARRKSESLFAKMAYFANETPEDTGPAALAQDSVQTLLQLS